MANDLNRSIKIYIDNSDATLKADQLRNKVNLLSAELAKLASTEGKDSSNYQRKKKSYDSATKSLNTYNNKVKETERVLKNLGRATYDELIKAKKELSTTLKKTERDTEDYRNKLLLLQKTEKEIAAIQKEMRTNGGRQDSMWSRASDGFNKYIGIVAAGVATITGISMSFRKLAEDVAHMDDVYADVMKTSGASKEQVLTMNEAFKKVDTRTTREEMNKMAEELGRMGVPVTDLTRATIAADKAAVALGDTFKGGAGEVANTLGLINGLYAETKAMDIDQSFMSIGSAMNELAANGVSSEPNIAAFVTRVGSMPEALKPAIEDALGLGAAFEESGIEAEIASRAYGIVLSRASTNTAAFAKQMKMSQKDVEDLINTNPTEFFLKFSESMKGMSAVNTAKTLKELKINAEGANKVVGAAANNTERFVELLELSNKSFSEATSLQNEFNIKNETLAAQLEKSKKAFQETALELGEKLNPILLKSVKGTTHLIKALVELPKWLKENRGLIITLTGALGAYILYLQRKNILSLLEISTYKNKIASIKAAIIATNLETSAIKNSSLSTRIAIAGTQGLAAAKLLLTGNIKGAIVAFKAMTAAMGLNPYVAAAAVIAALAIGIYKLVTHTTALEKNLKSSNLEIRKETENLSYLKTAIENTTEGTEARNNLIEEYNKIASKYNVALLNEKSTITELEASYTQLTQAMRQSHAERGLNATLEDLQTKAFDKQEKLRSKIVDLIQKSGKSLKNENQNYAVARQKAQEYFKTIEQGGQITSAELSKHGGYATNLSSQLAMYKASADALKKSTQEAYREFGKLVEGASTTYEPFEKEYNSYNEQLKKLKEGSKEYQEIESKAQASRTNMKSSLDIDIKNFTKEINLLKLAGESYSKQQETLDKLIQKRNTLNDAPSPSDKNKDKDNGGVPEDKEAKRKAELDLELKQLEEAYKKRRNIIERNLENEWQIDSEKNLLLLKAERHYLTERISVFENFNTSYEKLQTEANNQKLDDELKLHQNEIALDKHMLSEMQKTHQEQLKLTDKLASDERHVLKQLYDKKQITKEQYDARLLALDYNTAYVRQQAIEGYEKSLVETSLIHEHLKVDLVKKAGEDTLAASKITLEKLSSLEKNYYESNLSILQLYGKTSLSERKKQELDKIESLRNNTKKDVDGNEIADPLISEEAYEIAKTAIIKKYEEERLRVRMDYGIAKMDEVHQFELEALSNKLEQELLTQEEYEAAKLQIKLKHAQEYVQKGTELSQSLGNAVQAIEKAETDKITSEYTKRQSALSNQYSADIAAAGEDAEKKKAIQEQYNADKEQLEYEQKVSELETQKKYADANFALQVSQIISSTALAAMNAYSAMAGIPFVGPGLGIAAAALVAITGAAQIASAKAERDRVKALTIEAPSSSSSSTPSITGERTVKQAASGRYDVIGEEDGKLYRNVPMSTEPITGIVHQPTLISEQGSELIVSAPDLQKLQKHINYPLVVSAINDARNNTIPQRASGNYDAIQNSTQAKNTSASASSFDIALLQELIFLLRDLKENGVKAPVVLSELEKKQALQTKSKKIYSRGDNLTSK